MANESTSAGGENTMSEILHDTDDLTENHVVPPARWLHRWSILIVCLVWPLIWVGGQVTTYDAGMAVPDWPGTYGYNLFLYPYQTWLFGPFDLFIEHGHRLLGALVGFIAIIAVVVAFMSEPRRWVRGLTVAVLVAVIAQGALGGARVVLADRTLAMIHGCTAEIFFTLCVALMVVTSGWWWAQSLSEKGSGPLRRGNKASTIDATSKGQVPFRIGSQCGGNRSGVSQSDSAASRYHPTRGLIALCIAVFCLSYLQVVLGAQLRHVQPTASPGAFTHLVYTHISTALLVFVLVAVAAWKLRPRWSKATGVRPPESEKLGEKQKGCGDLTLSGPALLLLVFVVVQISLGLATWVARYGVPPFAQTGPATASYLVKSQAFVESLIITGHVATGAMVLVTSAFLLLRLVRVRHSRRFLAAAS